VRWLGRAGLRSVQVSALAVTVAVNRDADHRAPANGCVLRLDLAGEADLGSVGQLSAAIERPLSSTGSPG
jgi:hypothetical protein